MRGHRVIPLPTVEELLRVLPQLLVASGELAPRKLRGRKGKPAGAEYTYAVFSSLSPAWSNPDFEPQLERVDELERHFLERQIERTHRDLHLEATRPSPWVLTELDVATLTDWSIRIRTRNFYDDARLVTGDFHAWLTPDGDESKSTSPAQKRLAAAWPRWVVGRSPGLR